MLTIALPKGRIAKEVLDIFETIFNEKFEFENRKLILKKAGFTFLNVKKLGCCYLCRKPSSRYWSSWI